MATGHTDELDTLDVSRGEIWEANSRRPLFALMRAEKPVHCCPDSIFGPYWSVTRYDDIEEVEGKPAV